MEPTLKFGNLKFGTNGHKNQKYEERNEPVDYVRTIRLCRQWRHDKSFTRVVQEFGRMIICVFYVNNYPSSTRESFRRLEFPVTDLNLGKN